MPLINSYVKQVMCTEPQTRGSHLVAAPSQFKFGIASSGVQFIFFRENRGKIGSFSSNTLVSFLCFPSCPRSRRTHVFSLWQCTLAGWESQFFRVLWTRDTRDQQRYTRVTDSYCKPWSTGLCKWHATWLWQSGQTQACNMYVYIYSIYTYKIHCYT